MWTVRYDRVIGAECQNDQNLRQPMSDIRYYAADQVREALPMAEAIDAMRVAFTELSAGRVQMPQRTTVPCGDDALMLVMPGRCDVRFGLGAKIVSVFPENVSRGSI